MTQHPKLQQGDTPDPSAPTPPIRVFLADDHAVTLWGLRRLVESAHPHLSFAGSASTCEALLAHPALAQTDVVLLDLGLSDRNSINCVARLVNDFKLQVVLLTGDGNPSHHRTAVMRGARGVVLKSQPTEHILEAIQTVFRGDVWFGRALMALLLNAVPGSPASGSKDDGAQRREKLTPRERLVIAAVVAHRGAKSMVVAEALGMSESTLRNHLTV
ncbi:MAG: response regulator transcription factor, partial [Burkholderiaceae bacterium]